MYYLAVAKKAKTERYKNEKLLKAIGEHCKNLRVSKGYSIDRIYREGEQLSTSVIHRLENGSADTQISVFYRYAQVLGLQLKDLFNFPLFKILSENLLPYVESEPRPKQTVPYYDIQVAAGRFGTGALNENTPTAWVKIENHRQLSDYFATHVYGSSMEPTIPSGSLCLFRIYKGGSRQNKICLVKARGLKDPETDESFVVKRYKRLTPVAEASSRHQAVIHLISDNKSYPPIILMASQENEVEVLAEFIEVVEAT